MTARRKEEDVEASQKKAQSFGQQNGEARELAEKMEDLRNDLAELGNSVRALAQEGSLSAQRSVRETTDKFARRGHDLAEDVKAAGQLAVDRGSEMVKDTYNEFESTVRKNPTTAVIVALGLGYIAGLLSRNKS